MLKWRQLFLLMTRTQQLSSFSVPVARGAGLSLPRASRPVGGVPSRHTPTISAMFRSTVRPTVSSLVSSVCSRHLTLPSRGIASQSKKSRGSLSKQHSFLRLTADGRKEAHQQSLKSLQSELDLKARDIFSLAAQASSEASVSSKTNAFQQLWRSSSLLQLRSNCLLASFGNVRMILCHDTALFFNPNSAAVRSLTRSLPNFSQSEEPFCLQLLEHLLRESCDSFDRRLVLCHTITNSLVADMDSERVDSHDLVHRLVPLQDLLYNFELELREAQQSLLDLLNRDDDIRKLVLLGQRTFRPQIKSSEVSSEQLSTQQRMSSGVSKDIAEEPSIATADSANEAEHQLFADVFPSISMDRQPRKVQNPPLNSVHKDADLSSGNFSSNATSPAADNEAVTEVELLLESYALRLSQSLSLISFLQQQAKSRQDLTELRLQLRRNRLLSLNLTITSLTVSLGGMGAITTCFGMNLVTGLEESASAFPMVCAASAGTALLMFLGIRAAVLGDSGRMAESKKLRTRKTFEHAFADLQSLEIAIDAATRAVIERSSMSGGISSINNDLKSDPNQATSSSNSSTQLTMEEFGKILAEVKGVKELPRDEVECVFALVDSNYDGVLSLQESLELRQSFNRLKGSPEM